MSCHELPKIVVCMVLMRAVGLRLTALKDGNWSLTETQVCGKVASVLVTVYNISC